MSSFFSSTIQSLIEQRNNMVNQLINKQNELNILMSNTQSFLQNIEPTLVDEINQLEKEKLILENKMIENATDHKKLSELAKLYTEKQTEIILRKANLVLINKTTNNNNVMMKSTAQQIIDKKNEIQDIDHNIKMIDIQINIYSTLGPILSSMSSSSSSGSGSSHSPPP